MSATSRTIRGTSDTDDVIGTTRGDATVPVNTFFRRLVGTDARLAPTIARLALGIVMFPHGSQKMFGWFGGYGFAGTYGFFTTKVGLPGVIAAGVIIVELISSLMLIFGALSRIGAIGIAAIMVGAMITTHLPNGFFMNWEGNKAGEGFEYHLLALGLALVVLVAGGGLASVDRAMMKRRPAEGGSLGMQPVTRAEAG
jgi:putative oxidoreductase